MDQLTIAPKPTANSLKNELRESLTTLKTNFENLKRFVSEVGADEVSTSSITLTKRDIDGLLSVTLEIHDSANDIEFEANKIKEQLSRIVV